MPNAAHDIRYAFRMLRKSFCFTVVSVATLSLGIGATAGIILVARAMLFRPLPYADPSRVLVLWSTNVKRGWTSGPASVPDVLDWQRRVSSFAAIGGFTWTDYESFAATSADGAERISGVAVLPGLFEALQSRPLFGRDFLPQEFYGGQRVALLGYRSWKERFGGSPDLVGRTIRLNRQAYTIVGILPADFELPVITNAAQVLVPFRLDSKDATDRRQHLITVFGRLRAGIGVPQAQAEMTLISGQLASAHPEDADFGVRLAGLRDSEGLSSARDQLPIFLVTVLLMMLIAGANVAGILLSRFAARRGELATRTALGATRGRLIGQLTTESLLLTGTSGVLALIVALWVADFVVSLKPFYIPYTFTVHLDAGIVAIVAGLSLGLGFVFGGLPALTVANANLNEVITRVSARINAGWQERLRNGLIIVEVALSIAFLVGAALMIGTMWHITHVEIGFDPHNVAVGRMDLDTDRYGSPESQRAFYEKLIIDVAAKPGIDGVTAASHLVDFDPSGWAMANPCRLAGTDAAPVTSFVSVVMPNYFDVMRIPVRRGSPFSGRDDGPVAIVDETFAERLFPGANPIGREIELLDAPMRADEAVRGGRRTIVGVVSAIHRVAYWAKPIPQVYVPAAQNPVSSMFAIVRANAGGVSAIRESVARLDRDVAVYRASTMRSWIDRFYASQRFELLVLSVFGSIALVMTASGLYAAVAFRISQRMRELGIRLALGATHGSIQWLVLRQVGVVVSAGALAGIGLGAAVGRMLAKVLFGVKPFDTPSFVVIAAVVTLVSLAAAFVPIRRKALSNPILALRMP